jgi:predicted nucleic acid-binding protein
VFRILVDADLVLDALINRNKLTEDVRELLDGTHPSIRMYLTDIGWQKIAAYTSRLQNSEIAETVIDWLREKIQICIVDQQILHMARLLPLKDFESAVELVCVSDQMLDAIVTHKPADFVEAPNQMWVWSVADLWLRANLERQLQSCL